MRSWSLYGYTVVGVLAIMVPTPHEGDTRGQGKMGHQHNPLIRDSKADTIDQIFYAVDWLCQVLDSDDSTHPGHLGYLLTIRGALSEVRPSSGGAEAAMQ